MRRVGTIRELWRYPVSSVTGELLDAVEVTPDGLRGDRQYALVEVSSGIVAHPERDKRWQKSVFIRSRTAPGGDVEVQVPEHDWVSVGERRLTETLRTFFEFDVSIRPYQRTASAGSEVATAIDRYDVSPLHLLTSASVDHLKAIHPAGDPDRRRFRPNIFMAAEGDVTGFAELGWIDSSLSLGAIEAAVIAPTKRCGFTIIAQEGLANDPDMLRNVMKFGNRNMGVYCRPQTEGMLRVGDIVSIDR